MKIVIGGATSVGKSIVGYLSQGNNDIIVVDPNADRLKEISEEFDVQTVQGSVSSPEVQENINMKTTNMLIAVTESDEVNLVACQVAHTLFGVPKKVARVDAEFFLNPAWNTLYNEKNLPIDLVITPDIETAKAVMNLFRLPGSIAVYPFLEDKVNLFAFRHMDTDIPFMEFSLNHINNKLAELSAAIVMILRGNRRIIPNGEEVLFLQRNDVIYITCSPEKNMEIMRLFGVDHNPYEKVVIFGANQTSYYLAEQLEKDDNVVSCAIVDDDEKKARQLAEKLNTTTVISGEMMSDGILDDVGFASADVSIAVTDRDKDNLLISLLASKNKDTNAVSLINSKEYNMLSSNIRNSTIIDRSVVAISGILRYLRRARINEAYALGREMGEVWEIRLGDDSINFGRRVKELNIPPSSAILLIEHDGELLYETADYRLHSQDKLLVYVSPADIRRVENIFYR